MAKLGHLTCADFDLMAAVVSVLHLRYDIMVRTA